MCSYVYMCKYIKYDLGTECGEIDRDRSIAVRLSCMQNKGEADQAAGEPHASCVPYMCA